MPYRRYKNSSRRSWSTPCANWRGKRPAFRRQEGHRSGGPRPGMAPAASFSQGSHAPLASPHSGQSHRTWASSSCAAPQCGHVALARMPWPDTRAAVHMAPARSPRSSDFSNSVEAARSAARQAGPSAPSPSPPEGDGAPRLQLARGVAA